MSLLNKEETKALLDGIWNNQYDQTKLPYWLFSKIADGLEEATEQGWGNKLGSGSALKDLELEESLRKNVYFFAAHKTEKELAAFHELYKASSNKYSFVKEALKMNETWNFHWYNTEYNVTTRLARAGRDWRRIEETKDYYPLLRFLAVQDSNTRAEHAALHNIVRPVDDPFWKTYFPPLSWNCRCRVERMQTGTSTELKGKEMPPVKEQFQARVTDSKKIWNENHPYFQDTPKTAQKVIEQMVAQKIVEKKTSDVNVYTDYDKAKTKTAQWIEKQTDEVKEALSHYTLSDYADVNEILRGVQSEYGVTKNRKNELLDRIKIITKTLEKAPKYEGESYRMMSFWQKEKKYADAIIKQLEDGVFIDKGFMSSTKDLKTAEFFASKSKDDYTFKFTIRSKKGIAVDDVSANKGEEEILFNKNSKFKVVSFEKKDGIYNAILEDI